MSYPRIAGVVIVSCAALALMGRTIEAVEPQGTISGRVIDLDGNGLRGVHLWLRDTSSDAEVLTETWTDDNGAYRLGPTPAVFRAELLADANGFAREYRPWVSVFANQEAKASDVVLVPGRDAVGRIVDLDGQPRSDVLVTVGPSRNSRGHSGGYSGPPFQLRTDRRGEFRLKGVPSGAIEGFAHVPERAMAEFYTLVGTGNELVKIPDTRLAADVPITGTVKSRHGKPLAGIKVLTGRWGDREAVTDAQGNFALREFPGSQRVFLRISAPNFVYYEQKVPDDRAPMNIVLHECAWINGRAIDEETGKPVSIKEATLCNCELLPDGEFVVNGCRATNFEQPEPGRFRIPYTRPDHYQLSIVADGFQKGQVFLKQLAVLKDIDHVVLRLKRGPKDAHANGASIFRVS